MMRSVRVALIVGLTVTAAAVALVLTRSPPIVLGTNSVSAERPLVSVVGGNSICQGVGAVPRGTSAMRLSLSANGGPKLTLQANSGSLLITHGARGAGWGELKTVTVPVQRVSRTSTNAEICVKLGSSREPVLVTGAFLQVPGGFTRRYRVEYLGAGHRSWWSLASSVAHRMGLGHAASGTWIVFLELALMIAVAALASRLVLRELR